MKRKWSLFCLVRYSFSPVLTPWPHSRSALRDSDMHLASQSAVARPAGSASGMRHQSRALIALIVLLLARIIVINDGIISNATFTDKAARAIGKGKTDTDSLLVILICPLKRRCGNVPPASSFKPPSSGIARQISPPMNECCKEEPRKRQEDGAESRTSGRTAAVRTPGRMRIGAHADAANGTHSVSTSVRLSFPPSHQ